MSSFEMAFTPAYELARLIRDKAISPVELVNCYLERINKLNPKLNAYLTVLESKAKKEAALAEKAVLTNKELPPLHGVPVAVKDLEHTKGIRTTMGSLVYKNFVPKEDSITAERLRAAGAIILGKTNTPEFGLLGQTRNRLGEDGRNPWNTERTCGGSSGGSAAAIAAGLAPLATGTDWGGSINNPASLCGVFGMKPTLGRVPSWPIANPLLFSHNGPITRTVQDAALMLQVTAGHDRRDPMALLEEAPPYYNNFSAEIQGGLKGFRMAWSPDLGFAQVDPEVKSITLKGATSFESLGCELEEAKLELCNPFDWFVAIGMCDTYQELGHLLNARGDELYPNTAEELKKGGEVTAAEYSRGSVKLWSFRSRMAEFFGKYDLLVTPAYPVIAYPVGNPPKVIGGRPASPHWSTFAGFRVPWNITGYPTATLPCGWSTEGLPVGLLITSRWGREDLVLRAAAAFEAAHPWRDRIPAIARF
jgi:aspartyl-tRNA(Asn)/glutamyl-tRNA(Gln) amidotransferase subunit A